MAILCRFFSLEAYCPSPKWIFALFLDPEIHSFLTSSFAMMYTAAYVADFRSANFGGTFILGRERSESWNG